MQENNLENELKNILENLRDDEYLNGKEDRNNLEKLLRVYRGEVSLSQEDENIEATKEICQELANFVNKNILHDENLQLTEADIFKNAVAIRKDCIEENHDPFDEIKSLKGLNWAKSYFKDLYQKEQVEKKFKGKLFDLLCAESNDETDDDFSFKLVVDDNAIENFVNYINENNILSQGIAPETVKEKINELKNAVEKFVEENEHGFLLSSEDMPNIAWLNDKLVELGIMEKQENVDKDDKDIEYVATELRNKNFKEFNKGNFFAKFLGTTIMKFEKLKEKIKNIPNKAKADRKLKSLKNGINENFNDALIKAKAIQVAYRLLLTTKGEENVPEETNNKINAIISAINNNDFDYLNTQLQSLEEKGNHENEEVSLFDEYDLYNGNENDQFNENDLLNGNDTFNENDPFGGNEENEYDENSNLMDDSNEAQETNGLGQEANGILKRLNELRSEILNDLQEYCSSEINKFTEEFGITLNDEELNDEELNKKFTKKQVDKIEKVKTYLRSNKEKFENSSVEKPILLTRLHFKQPHPYKKSKGKEDVK